MMTRAGKLAHDDGRLRERMTDPFTERSCGEHGDVGARASIWAQAAW